MSNDRDVRNSQRWAGWSMAAALLGAFLFVGAAAPAKADSNFSRGFEDQMGRILAFEAVNLGKQVLFQGVVQPVRHRSDYRSDHRSDHRDHGYYDRYRHDRHYYRADHRRSKRYNDHDDDRRYSHRDRHRRHWRHHRHERRHHRHDRHCKANHRY